MMVCIFTTTCHLYCILIGVPLSLPEILQVSPLKTMYLSGIFSSGCQNAQPPTPLPTNQSIHHFALMITLIGGTSYSTHIASIKLCTSEHESTFGQRMFVGPLKKLITALITYTTTLIFPLSDRSGGPSIYTFRYNKITFLDKCIC